MNHMPFARWNCSDQLLLAIAMLSFLALWVRLAGTPLSMGGLLLLATYIAGGLLWTTISQLSWPSRSSCLAYCPIGFGMSTGLCALCLPLSLGLVYSLLLSTLFGAIAWIFISIRQHSWSTQCSGKVSGRASAEVVGSTVLLLLLITVLFASQLQSASTLTTLKADTFLLAWNDYIAHARTTLEVSTAAVGALPQSFLDQDIRLAPYHYGHYILPALLLNQGLAVGPLQAYTALAPPFGAFLLLLPILERFRSAGFARITEAFPFSIGAMLIYGLWLHFASDTFVDPIWLLVAGPGTMYAGAVLLAFLQIYITSAFRVNGRDGISLTAVVATLLLLYKVHLLHSFFIFFAIVASNAFFSGIDYQAIPGRLRSLWRRCYRYLIPATIGALVLAALNVVLRMQRTHLAKDFVANALKFTEYFSGATFDSYAVSGLVLSVKDVAYILFCVLVGLMVMVGPLYGLALLLSRSSSFEQAQPSRAREIQQLLLALLGSLLVAVLLAPDPPWWPDSSEFQNRVWPVLWCIALWYLAGLRMPLARASLRQCVLALQVVALIACVQMIPAPKRLSIAAATSASQAYPTVIALSEKTISHQLMALPSSLRFFASKEPFESRDNEWHAPLLAALSGRLPLYAFPNFQILKGNKTIQSDWETAASQSAQACMVLKGNVTKKDGSPRVALVQQAQSQFAAVCR